MERDQDIFQTYVLIHGWLGSDDSELNVLIKDALMETEICQVIVVSWTAALNKFYPWPRFQVTNVGNQIGDLLGKLSEAGIISLNTTTIIGHSLG